MAEYIEREALLENLRKSHRYHAGNNREESLLYRDIRIVNEQPAADVAPVVHGRWELNKVYGELRMLRVLTAEEKRELLEHAKALRRAEGR